MKLTLQILGQEIVLECAPGECRRLEDLAASLNTRLAGVSGDPDAVRRLVIVSLGLLDEAQASAAAVVRAHGEIERLNDIIAEARIEAGETLAPSPDRGRVHTLRAGTA